MSVFDPRTTLARDDLADQALDGVLAAGAYRTPEALQCVVGSASIRREPDPHAEQFDQLMFGEIFDALDERDGWIWGRARRDGYVGWLEPGAVAGPVLVPTHRVSALRSYAFPQPDMKAAPPVLLPLNALVTVEETQAGFARVARLGWVPLAHLDDLLAFETDPVAVAERHIGAPYQWGGRESVGLDCSGLVQQALFACGRACPRDADLQEHETGEPIDAGHDFSALSRGDLVFWDGHVGLMVDPERILHANAHHMAVAIEPLAAVVARNRAAGVGDPTSFRRI